MNTNPLYITISQEGAIKVGTCDHCVIREPQLPDRAWQPDGDKELDFDRDALIAHLATLGVIVNISQEYVCP